MQIRLYNSSNNNHIALRFAEVTSRQLVMPFMLSKPVTQLRMQIIQKIGSVETILAQEYYRHTGFRLTNVVLDGSTLKIYANGSILRTVTVTPMTVNRLELTGGAKKLLVDEMFVAPNVATSDDVETWYNLDRQFLDLDPVITDDRIPSAEEWNRKVRTFHQSSPPTASAVGDLWFDTSDNDKPRRWDGQNWVDASDKSPIPDERIPSAESWSKKNRTYYQDTPPTGTHSLGDVWFDTSDHNRRHWWDGSKWVDAEDVSPIDASQRPVTARGLGGDIEMDKDGMRFIRKADGKVTLQMDVETGSAFFKGDITGATGTFSGGISGGNGAFELTPSKLKIVTPQFTLDEAGNAAFSGDITGASGTFAGTLAAESIEYANLKIAYARVSSARAYVDDTKYTYATIVEATSPEEWNLLDFVGVYWYNGVTKINIKHNSLTSLAGGPLIQLGVDNQWSEAIDLTYSGYISANYLSYLSVGDYELAPVVRRGSHSEIDFTIHGESPSSLPIELRIRFKRHAIG